MKYEEIRKARLQHPFRPFKLRFKDGKEYIVQEAETLAITPMNLVFQNSNTGAVVMSSADEVESLTYVEESSKVSA